MHLFEKIVCHKKKPPKHPRKNGFSLPPHPIQILGWILLLGFECIYVGAIIPTLPKHWMIISHVINGILFGVQLVLELWVMYINPAHPNLLKNWRSEVAPFERSKHSHVIENYHCNICDIDVQEDCKHCVECNKCVANFDHHCKWLNTCIGGRNYREFFSYISVCFILFLWLIGVNIAVIVIFFVQKSWLGPHKIGAIWEDGVDSDPNIITYQVTELLVFVPVPDTVWISVICTNLFVLILATSLLTYLVQLHIRLIFKQTTTYKMILEKREKMKNAEKPTSKFLFKTQLCTQKISIAPAPLTYPMGSQDMEYIIRPGLAMPMKENKRKKKLINRQKNQFKWCSQSHNGNNKDNFQKKLSIAMAELPVLQTVYPPEQILKINGSASFDSKKSNIQKINDSKDNSQEPSENSQKTLNQESSEIVDEFNHEDENERVQDYSAEIDTNSDMPADILHITRLSNISRLGSTHETSEANLGVPDEVNKEKNISYLPQQVDINCPLRLDPIKKPLSSNFNSDHQDILDVNAKTEDPLFIPSHKTSKTISANLPRDAKHALKSPNPSLKLENGINVHPIKCPATPIMVLPRQEEKTGFHVVTLSNDTTPIHHKSSADRTVSSLECENERTSNSQIISNQDKTVFFRVQRGFPTDITPKDQPHIQLSPLLILDHVRENEVTSCPLPVQVQENTENTNMYI